MSDSRDLPVGPVQPVGSTPPVQPVGPRQDRAASGGGRAGGPQQHPAAATGGNLPGTYAQFFINRDTHEVVIRVLDSATDRVIDEYPSADIEAMNAYIAKYVDTAARHRAAQSSGSGS